MSGWNQAPLPRDQILLFRETLGDRIPANHTVRLFAEILDSLDWSSWERHYVLVSGQPPIHPKIIAGVILYGLSLGIRSSRRLEWACAHAIDFMWLAEGRTIDHSTFCNFRTKFPKELKDLFRQIGRVAIHMGLLTLNQVALDGTRVRANSYYCPQGRKLAFDGVKTKGCETGGDSEYRVYKCASCEGCGLASDCLSGTSKRRTVSHDQHEPVRQKVAARLKTASGQKAYARRAHLAETPNAVIKQVMGLRQFLLRGLDKVRTEWLWACTAFNIRKLVAITGKLRAEVALKPV